MCTERSGSDGVLWKYKRGGICEPNFVSRTTFNTSYWPVLMGISIPLLSRSNRSVENVCCDQMGVENFRPETKHLLTRSMSVPLSTISSSSTSHETIFG